MKGKQAATSKGSGGAAKSSGGGTKPSASSMLGQTATRCAVPLIRSIIWGAVLKSVGFDNPEQAVDVLALADLLPDVAESDGVIGGNPLTLAFLADAAEKAAMAWQGQHVKANARTLLQLVLNMIDYR